MADEHKEADAIEQVRQQTARRCLEIIASSEGDPDFAVWKIRKEFLERVTDA